MLCSWLFLSGFPCRPAESSGRFRSATRRWRDERNWIEFLLAPFIPPATLSPRAADSSFLLPLSCLRFLKTRVCCLCEGRAGGLDPFTRSLGGPGRVSPAHVIFLPRPSLSATLLRSGRGEEGDVCDASTEPKWPLSEECVVPVSVSRSVLGDVPFFSDE